jgi:hypothetical protein
LSENLKPGGVAQSQRGHLDGRRRGEHWHGVAALGQERQASGVIETAAREQHAVEALLRSGGRPVEGLGLVAALKRAAIDQHAGPPGLPVTGRAGDFTARRADNSGFHGSWK